jgi:hypothetical protein
MNLLSIWLIRSDDRKDDQIDFKRGRDAMAPLNVSYKPGDIKTTYNFTLTRGGVRTYLGNLFRALQADQDPWEQVQISAVTGPAIMYHVSDLEAAEDIIMGTIDTALYANVELD